MGVPIRWGDEFLGVLNVVGDSPRTFFQADAELLSLFATQVAIAIRNARLYDQTQQDAKTKATLLHEVNHRVGNNLAAIIGLLALEQKRTGIDQATYQAVMADLINRIQGLATVHQMLSAAEWSPLLLSELAEQVIGSALGALPVDKYVSVEVSPSPVRVRPKDANNLALVVNELTTNSCKYAWPERQSGRIAIRIGRQGDLVALEYRDDGLGYPEEVLRLERHSVGWKLIQTVVGHSLQGEVSLHNDRGAVTTVRFPAD
jgi:two-component sensor histidine kinase